MLVSLGCMSDGHGLLIHNTIDCDDPAVSQNGGSTDLLLVSGVFHKACFECSFDNLF